MEEKLKLIQSLRLEVEELVKLRNDAENNYRNSKNEMDNHSNFQHELDKKNDNINKLEWDFLGKKADMMMLFTWPIGILACILCFSYLSAVYSSAGWAIGSFEKFLTIFFAAVAGIVLTAAPAFLLSFELPEKIERFLCKKFNRIRKYREQINNLINEVNTENEKFKNLKIKTTELYNYYTTIEEKLERKREELDSVEKEYFDSLIGKTFINEDGNHYTIGIVGRGKTKVRIPEDKNLSN